MERKRIIKGKYLCRVFEKKGFPISFIYVPSERAEGGGGYRHFLNPLLAQHAAIGDRREVAKREENRAESACLSSLMMQSARNTLTPLPKSPSPARSSDDITSLGSSMAENSCRAGVRSLEILSDSSYVTSSCHTSNRAHCFQD